MAALAIFPTVPFAHVPMHIVAGLQKTQVPRVRVRGAAMFVKRDLRYGKRDLLYGKRDLLIRYPASG